MPSVLDATLAIQMVHFLCAYWILSKIFLKPAYALIIKIEAERAELKHQALKQQHELTVQRQEKLVEFAEFQQRLLKVASMQQPPEVSHESSGKAADVESPQIDQEFIKGLAESLKGRVIHDH